MNRSQIRALAIDALRQVLDNWVFRILAVLALVPILFTFLVGFREDEISICFGVKTWSYAQIFESFGVPVLPNDPQGRAIEALLSIVFDNLAGSLGVLLALSATSFFVPQMLEKGAADLYFHKPLSRAWLYLSRYFAGLVFVGLVSAVLVVGMYLGLALVSRHQDPGVLVAALQLTYVFALVHGVSMLAGVITRSTVGAILLSAFFFLFNGCIHGSWIAVVQQEAGALIPKFDERGAELADDAPPPAATTATAAAEVPAVDEERGDSITRSTGWRVFSASLAGVHYVLPKTTDADVLGRKLRAAIAAPAFHDPKARLNLYRVPAGMEALDTGTADDAGLPRTALGEPALAGSGSDALVWSLWIRPAEQIESRSRDRVKVRPEMASQAGQKVGKLLDASGATEITRESADFGSAGPGGRLSGTELTWRTADGTRVWLALAFKGGSSENVFTLLVGAPTDLGVAQLAERAHHLSDQFGIDSPEEWYPSQLGFTAPLRFNVLFSVGSSLAFTAAVLFLGIWRLRRIAF